MSNVKCESLKPDEKENVTILFDEKDEKKGPRWYALCDYCGTLSASVTSQYDLSISLATTRKEREQD